MASSTSIFSPANKAIADDIIKELRLQGHYLTGALERSIHHKEIAEGRNIILTAEALEYLEDLEKGIPANHISMDQKSIAEMTRYVELRMGYKGKYAIKVALLILKRQRKEGMPTKNSYNYSQTVERKFAVEDTFYNNDKKYFDLIDDVAVGQLDNEFHQIKSGTT